MTTTTYLAYDFQMVTRGYVIAWKEGEAMSRAVSAQFSIKPLTSCGSQLAQPPETRDQEGSVDRVGGEGSG